MQLRINAARARTYRTAQLIAGIVAFFVGVLVLTNREYMAPFGTAVGQLVLAWSPGSSASRCGPWSCCRSPFDLLACCGSVRARPAEAAG